MNPGRITITRRHTGRFYVGLDAAHFFGLYELVLGASLSGRKLPPNQAAVADAFARWAAKIKAKAGMSPTPHSALRTPHCP